MDKQARLEHYNTLLPPCLQVLNTRLVDFDSEAATCEMHFDIGEQFCHSVDTVQGGFITAMLDAAMSHSAYISHPDIIALPTLELKVNFLDVTRAGPVKAFGRVVKAGRSTVFLEGYLVNQAGKQSATATATAKMVRSRHT